MLRSRHPRNANGRRGARLRRAAAVAAIGAAMAAGGGAFVASAKMADPGPIDPPAAKAPVPGLSEMVEQLRPAVVSVIVEAQVDAGPQFRGNEQFREFFERFFGQQPGRDFGERRVRGAGSGFLVSADGHVVTNNHVVGQADKIQVVLDDGTKLDATLEGTDPKTDLALLKVETDEPLPYVELGSSENTRAGDWVVAIGNPFGLGGTVTTGIVSARGRDINAGPYDDFLQIDAPINRGNSGGPLFNLDGEVVGVNTAIFSPSGGNIGIGFAIPANQASDVIESLKARGYVSRGKLGVQIQSVTAELAQGLELEEARGALVSNVVDGSPAEQAGIRVGDVIVGFNGEQVEDADMLPELVANAGPGAESEVTVLREGERRVIDVTLAELERTAAKARSEGDRGDDGLRLGIRVAPVNDEVRARLDLAESVTGAVVVDVRRGSPAARAGLKPGDVIMQASGESVDSPQALIEAVEGGSDQLTMLINRRGNQFFTTLSGDEASG